MGIRAEMKRTKKASVTLKQAFNLLAAVLIVAFAPLWAVSAELKIIPSIGLMESYNDNIYLTPDYHVKGWITTATPGLLLSGRTEKLDVGLSARGKFDYYMGIDDSALPASYIYKSGEPIVKNTSLNSVSQYYNAVVGYTFTPRFRLMANAGWTRDYQPDREMKETGLVMGNYRRDRINAGLTGTWNITEKLTMGAGYSFAQDYYNIDEMSDMTIHSANLFLYYAFTPRLKGRLHGGYSHYYFLLTEQDTNMVWGTVGFEYQYHELWKITVDGGTRFAQSKYEGYDDSTSSYIKVKSNDWGGIFRTALEYNDEKNRLVLGFNYDIAPASSSMGNGPVQRLVFTATAQRRIIYELSAMLSGGYYINRAAAKQFGTTEINVDTYQISPGLRYEFKRDDIYVDLTYDFTNIHDRCLETYARRNLVMLRLYVQWPITL